MSPMQEKKNTLSTAEDVVIEDLVLKSTVQNLPIPNADVATFLRTRLQEHPGDTALIDGATGQRHTFGELEAICESIAAGFQELGLRPGDTVCFVSPNTIDLIAAFIATAFAGGVIACVKTVFNERETERVLSMTKPTFIYCDIASAATGKHACNDVPSVKVLVTTGDYDGMVNFSKLKETPRRKYKKPATAGPEDIFTVFLSSGTTGLPKAALISHSNFVAELVTFGYKNPGLNKGAVFLAYLPVMHAAPFMVCFTAITHYVETVIVAAMDLTSVLPPIPKYKVTNLVLYPTHAMHMVQKGLPPTLDISSVRNIFLAGSAIPPQVMGGLIKVFPGCTIYHGLYQQCFPPGNGIRMTSQYVYADNHWKVVDVDTRKKLGPGECGEICIKGPTCFKGYLDNPDATAEIYDNEGYLKSGDTGYYTARGELYVLDRMKDFVKCMDLQVVPAELEELLQDHADVAQAAVIGVPHSTYGEASRAFIVLKVDARPKTPNEEQSKQQELVKYIENLVAVHKQLHGGVEFVDVIPQTPTGKPNRRELKEAFLVKGGAAAPKPE